MARRPNYKSARGFKDAPYAWTPANQAAMQQAQSGVFDTVGSYKPVNPAQALVPIQTGIVPVGDVTTQKESLWKRGSGAEALGTAADVVGDAAADAAGKGGGLKGFFANTKANLGNAWGNIKAGKGVMPQYAGLARGMAGAMAGLKAIQGVSDYQSAKEDTDALVNDILASAAGNSMYRYDLSADQLATLRKLQNGSYDTTGDFDMDSLLGNLGNIATGAGVGFVTGGGIPGAILGGLGGVVDGVSSGMVGNQEQITADLQSLYDALYESEMRNKQMKRDAAYARYANGLY
jgi:hypothetical protein